MGYSKRLILLCCVLGFYALGALYVYNALKNPEDFVKFDTVEDVEANAGGKRFQLVVDSLPARILEKDEKKILLWTKFYSDGSLENYCVNYNSLDTCSHKQCKFTVDKNELDSSDAVVFHGRDLAGDRKIPGYEDTYIDFPGYRYEDQLWIYLMFEAPIHTWINMEPLDSIFNMTMTYRPDSDIYIPYGRMIHLEKAGTMPRLPLVYKNSTTNKRLVAWSVSNCYKTPSRRNEVVHELQKHIQVDIYGSCGSFSCTPYKSLCTSVLECHEYLGKRYKFYLAFENSLCEDYITEKFFNALYVGMIPVVYGYGDYAKVAPKGSYIDATVFPTMKSLAMYLLYLDAHPAEFEKYFKWRNHYTISPYYFNDAWCALCTKLWTTESAKDGDNGSSSSNHQVHNLTEWWFQKSSRNSSLGNSYPESACISPFQLNWDHNMFSFYSFLYYPNYTVKISLIFGICAILSFIVVFYFYVQFRHRKYHRLMHHPSVK